MLILQCKAIFFEVLFKKNYICIKFNSYNEKDSIFYHNGVWANVYTLV